MVAGDQVGEGEFGTVHKAKWYGTIVAVKILRRSDAVAVGDFRSALCFGGRALVIVLTS